MWSWIGRHYSRARLQEGRAPAPLREPFEAYFRGEARVLGGVPWQASGTPFQLKVLATLSTISAGETLSYRELAERIGQSYDRSCRGTGQRRQPGLGRRALSPGDRKRWIADRLRWGLPRKKWLLEHDGVTAEA
jgi:methylated-DNA-[protein]-cysteine S-methyltransferase